MKSDSVTGQASAQLSYSDINPDTVIFNSSARFILPELADGIYFATFNSSFGVQIKKCSTIK